MSRRVFGGIALASLIMRPSNAATTTISLGEVTNITVSLAPVILATSMGFLEEEGLQVTNLEFQGGGVLFPQLANKRVTVGFPSPDPLVLSRQPGKDPLPMRYFYNSVRRSLWEFGVLAESQITDLRQLKGKKLGVGALTWGNLSTTRALLRELGLEPAEYELVPVGTGAPAALALQKGQVDALNLADSMLAVIENIGVPLRRLAMPAKYQSLLSDGFVAHEDTIRERPEILAGFGRAIAKATIAANANPAGCVKAFWRAFPNQKPTKGDDASKLAQDLRVLQSRLPKLVSFEPDARAQFGEYPKGAWRSFVEVLHAGGQLSTTDIDVESLYTNQFVPQFNDFDHDEVLKKARSAL
ncbi:ABC transporter substrate-binding protein [Bradyrhizobium uaiense]|nr:ABC transporter substrate-binding protein [Bradyrhizobium uaiense]